MDGYTLAHSGKSGVWLGNLLGIWEWNGKEDKGCGQSLEGCTRSLEPAGLFVPHLL